jgi:hypothetical protein
MTLRALVRAVVNVLTEAGFVAVRALLWLVAR